MRKVYGQEEETFGKTWDEVRHLLHDAGMKKDSYIVEWSNSGIDYSFLKMIMQQHTPSNSIILIHPWRTVLPGFSSMKLSHFHPFLYPDSSIHEYAHQASSDSLMLVEAMRALIDLAHRDDPRAEEFGTGELRIDEQISQLQEQLKMEYDKDDESDDSQSGSDVDSLEAQIAHEEAMKVMTDEEKELADLFLKSFGTLPSVDSISGPTNSSSVGE
jgi:DNA polymerase III epsilon subunit-like protein